MQKEIGTQADVIVELFVTLEGRGDPWVTRQQLRELYQQLLVTDLEFALDKKVEQDLWNHAFKNQISALQRKAKDKMVMLQSRFLALV